MCRASSLGISIVLPMGGQRSPSTTLWFLVYTSWSSSGHLQIFYIVSAAPHLHPILQNGHWPHTAVLCVVHSWGEFAGSCYVVNHWWMAVGFWVAISSGWCEVVFFLFQESHLDLAWFKYWHSCTVTSLKSQPRMPVHETKHLSVVTQPWYQARLWFLLSQFTTKSFLYASLLEQLFRSGLSLLILCVLILLLCVLSLNSELINWKQ